MAQVVETPEIASVADGVTASFSIPFTYAETSEVVVSVLAADGATRTAQVEGVDYTVSGANVVFLSGHIPADGSRVERRRRTPAAQPEAFGDDAAFRPQANEQAFDKGVRMIQEERARNDRAIAAPVGETGATLPAQASRDGKVAWFDGAEVGAFAIEPGQVLGADPATGRPVSIPLQVSVDGSTASVSSRLAAQAVSWTEGALFIQAQGHLAAGDGGRALWAKVDNQPNHAGKFQSADGAWWEIAEPVIDPLALGAAGDGLTDDRNALALADDAAFAVDRPLRITRPLRIATNITVEAPVAFEGAGQIIPDDGVRVWLKAPFTAGLNAVFDLSNGGRIIPSDAMTEVWGAWWGLSDTRNDNQVPVQQAIDALEGVYADRTQTELIYAGGRVNVHRGVFLTTSMLTQRHNVMLQGFSRHYSRFTADADNWDGSPYMLLNVRFERQALIAGITAANPPVVETVEPHGFSNGDTITIEDVEGMTEANQPFFKVANVTADTFTLKDAYTSADINGSAWTAYTGGGTATDYRSQFGVRCQDIAFDGGNLPNTVLIAPVFARSWNEQCGLERCLILNFNYIGVMIRDGYGGSAYSCLKDCEIMGNHTPLSRNIDVQMLAGFTTTFFALALERCTLTGCVNGVVAADKVCVVANVVHIEDADQGLFLYSTARVSGTLLKASRDCAALIGLNTDWTGRIDGLPYVQGPATNVLVDFRTGKSSYTPYKGENASGTINYPFRGKSLFGAFIVAGETPPTPDPDTLLASVTRPAIGTYRCTMKSGFNLANANNYYGTAHASAAGDAGKVLRVVPLTGTIFDVFCDDAATGAAVNVEQLIFEIFHKP